MRVTFDDGKTIHYLLAIHNRDMPSSDEDNLYIDRTDVDEEGWGKKTVFNLLEDKEGFTTGEVEEIKFEGEIEGDGEDGSRDSWGLRVDHFKLLNYNHYSTNEKGEYEVNHDVRGSPGGYSYEVISKEDNYFSQNDTSVGVYQGYFINAQLNKSQELIEKNDSLRVFGEGFYYNATSAPEGTPVWNYYNDALMNMYDSFDYTDFEDEQLGPYEWYDQEDGMSSSSSFEDFEDPYGKVFSLHSSNSWNSRSSWIYRTFEGAGEDISNIEFDYRHTADDYMKGVRFRVYLNDRGERKSILYSLYPPKDGDPPDQSDNTNTTYYYDLTGDFPKGEWGNFDRNIFEDSDGLAKEKKVTRIEWELRANSGDMNQWLTNINLSIAGPIYMDSDGEYSQNFTVWDEDDHEMRVESIEPGGSIANDSITFTAEEEVPIINWNESNPMWTVSAGGELQKEISISAYGSNHTNVTITKLSGPEWIDTDVSKIDKIPENESEGIEFTISPPSDQPEGVYASEFYINSTEDPDSDTLTLYANLTTEEEPELTPITPTAAPGHSIITILTLFLISTFYLMTKKLNKNEKEN